MGTQMLNPANVMNVLITQTGGEDCYDMESCIRLLRLMEVSCKIYSIKHYLKWSLVQKWGFKVLIEKMGSILSNCLEHLYFKVCFTGSENNSSSNEQMTINVYNIVSIMSGVGRWAGNCWLNIEMRLQAHSRFITIAFKTLWEFWIFRKNFIGWFTSMLSSSKESPLDIYFCRVSFRTPLEPPF